MKAVTVHQPWATLLAYGEKKYMTRTWYPNCLDRGDRLAIHAGKSFNRDVLAVPAIRAALKHIRRRRGHVYWGGDKLQLPQGKVLAVARLEHVLETERAAAGIEDHEREMGDWSDGRYAWRLRPLTRPESPIPARGQQGLWDWNPDVEATDG